MRRPGPTSDGRESHPGPGTTKVSGRPTAPGEVQVLIKAKGSALKTLKSRGDVSVKVTIAFTAGGRMTTNHKVDLGEEVTK